MKPPRKADIFVFMLKENNNNNLRLLKSAALTALENASHLPTDTNQLLLLLCHHCFERDQPGCGHGCSLLRRNPRPPSSPFSATCSLIFQAQGQTGALAQPSLHHQLMVMAHARGSCRVGAEARGPSWSWGIPDHSS